MLAYFKLSMRKLGFTDGKFWYHFIFRVAHLVRFFLLYIYSQIWNFDRADGL